MFARSLLRSAATPRFALPLAASPTPFGALLNRSLSSTSKAIIDQAVASHPLVVFMKGTPEAPQCGFSRAVIQILGVHDVPPAKMKTYNCLEDQELREGIKEYSDWPTIPQVYLSGEFVGGCDILLAMHSSGELETLLVKEGVIPEHLEPESSEPKKD